MFVGGWWYKLDLQRDVGLVADADSALCACLSRQVFEISCCCGALVLRSGGGSVAR